MKAPAMLLHSERASAAMAKYGLDGPLASMPANVYHAADFNTPPTSMETALRVRPG
jgi:hypothetical protein